ncbi:MAG: 3-keto-5-aminohexanoate cleavage protein [Planctomycetota bacterium]
MDFINDFVEDVLKACELGITMAHLHVRDEVTQQSCYKMDRYARVIEGIRAFAPTLVICVSTSGRIFNDFEKRSEVLHLTAGLKPDMASLTLSSLNFNSQASINDPNMISRLAQKMLDNTIKPELEVFDSGMVNYAKYLIKKGILKPPYYFNLILGNISCAQADLLHAGLLINDLPEQTVFSIGGVGNYQLRMNSLAVSMGCGVRVGLEDNIWYDNNRTKLASNADLLRRIKEIARANERELMTSSELRNMLGLNHGFGAYGVKDS